MLFSTTFVILSTLFSVNAIAVEERAAAKYLQHTSGPASFTVYSGCGAGACGMAGYGYTAAINQLAFGAEQGGGPGDACGRCFRLTGTGDPYSPNYKGPFYSIVVKVNNLCPGGGLWCGQTVSNPVNQVGKKFHFDICQDTGGASAFFPSGRGALTGEFAEVSCKLWSGSDGYPAWNGACLAGEKVGFWPAVGCGNQGSPPL